MKHRNLKISYEIDGVIFTVLSIGKDTFHSPIPRHSHSKNSYELHYISSGTGTLIADSVKYELSPNDFFMTGPGIEHEQISNPLDPMTEYGIYLQISNEKRLAKRSPINLFINNKFWFGNIDLKCYEIMKSILEELENQPYGYEQMLPPLLKQLTIMIIREYNRGKKNNKAQIEKNISPQDLLYLNIEEEFLYNYKDISLDILSENLNIGARQIERILKNHYGKTFTQMKTDARMSAAGLLLTETGDSIQNIAEKLGYSSSEHFTNAFKGYYKITPSKYRKLS